MVPIMFSLILVLNRQFLPTKSVAPETNKTNKQTKQQHKKEQTNKTIDPLTTIASLGE